MLSFLEFEVSIPRQPLTNMFSRHVPQRNDRIDIPMKDTAYVSGGSVNRAKDSFPNRDTTPTCRRWMLVKKDRMLYLYITETESWNFHRFSHCYIRFPRATIVPSAVLKRPTKDLYAIAQNSYPARKACWWNLRYCWQLLGSEIVVKSIFVYFSW